METNFLDLHQRPFDSAAQGLCGSLRTILFQIPESVKEKAQEIRLRANRPVAVYTGKETYFVKEQGRLTQRFDRTLPIVSSQEILDSFHHCCSYSVYSHQHEIRQGFVTMAGGHRVGVCGTAVYEENRVSGIRDISSLNIRIAREVYGAADELLRELDFWIADCWAAFQRKNNYLTGSCQAAFDKREKSSRYRRARGTGGSLSGDMPKRFGTQRRAYRVS